MSFWNDIIKKKRKQEIHIFNVDHTLIRQSIVQCFLHEALKNRLITVPHLLGLPYKFVLYKRSMLNPDFVEKEIKILKGIKIDLLRELSSKSFRRQGKDQVFTDAVKLINNLKSKGHRIIITTSSVEFLIEPLLEFLGLDEFIATKIETHNGLSTGNIIGKPMFGGNKKTAIEEYFKEQSISLDDAVFYTDSYNDLSLLSKCGKAIPVNPDKRLLKEAAKHGWSCMLFKDTLGST